MLFVQLRSERTSAVPVRRVTDGDCSLPMNAPRKLILLFDGEWLPSGKSFNSLDTAAEVADFVKRVPSRHLQKQVLLHVGNGHCDAKEMLRWLGQRNLVRKRCTTRKRNREAQQELQKTDEAQREARMVVCHLKL